ncbi:MAG: type IV pilus twitching motility protein PilT [Abditibacteriota bacterium]|nr:type IV pilus twitching motility protein PilT [Abditibacteriota bacterium]MBP5092944.1 type IV pilus twitching motility protein PilT [Abditibacteriota bacterium]
MHIDHLLAEMVERGASDLHICTDLPPVIRIDGKLQKMNYTKFTASDTQRMLYEILTDEQIQRFEDNWELDFSYSLQKLARFRVNFFKDKGTVASAFRIIPVKIPTIRELQLPSILEEVAKKPRGLILVTGPTGSGKSTTLAAMINQINTDRSEHIITIEDPIEYLHHHKQSIINQREVGQDTKEFANALRGALREDPDIILVGEMRDLETMANAIRAAETGHLVFATLHTNSAASTVDRIVDSFPAEQQEQIRLMLSNSLQAVICQQLLRRAGLPGRVCCMEIMIATPAIRNLVREAKSHQLKSMIQTGGSFGMQTMDQHLAELYTKGVITFEDALARAMDPEELKNMIASGVNR